MGRESPKGEGGGAACPRYLPYLTWALLALLGLWFVVWFFFQRPTTAEQLRVATFREALRYVPEQYAREVEQEELYHAAMRGMMNSLPDPYSKYVSPTESERLLQQTEGEFGGIGVTVRAGDGLPVIVEVNPDGPAARADLRAGDVIVGVDGQDIEGRPLFETVELIRGEVGTEVELTIRRPAENTSLATTIERATISFANVSWRMMPDDLAYVELVSFDRDCADEMRRALREAQQEGTRGVILDLRGNGGGLMEQALPICDMFLKQGVILRVDRRHSTEVHRADEDTVLDPDIPLVVLVDSMTASAAEILAGALQTAGRATVVGTPTVGKGSVTQLVRLPDGGYLNLTVARYVLANDRVVEGQGIRPDVVVGELAPMPEGGRQEVKEWMEHYRQSRKEQLDRAVALLRERLSEEPREGEGRDG